MNDYDANIILLIICLVLSEYYSFVNSLTIYIYSLNSRHNEDGSYTYGYEAADGSFKIETKSSTGEVKGKYGYRDDTGKVLHFNNTFNELFHEYVFLKYKSPLNRFSYSSITRAQNILRSRLPN